MALAKRHTREELEEYAALLEAEQIKAEALFQSIGDGALALDEHGKIIRINQVALDMLGFSEDEVLGAWYPATIIATDEDNNPIDIAGRPITKAYLSGKSVTERFFLRRKSGNTIPVIVTVSPILFDGRPMGSISVFRDFTRELEIERAKDEFISLASHQLRTPLTSIRMYTEMLENGFAGELSEIQNQFVVIINASVMRMATLIDSLLSVARVESGSVVIRPKVTNLNTLLDDIVQELKPRIEEKKLVLKIDTEHLPNVRTDPILVKEVLANLITNAAKYTPEKGSITIELKKQGNNALFVIADSGYGIPKQEQRQIFTKFYRASNITQRDTTGTGIGLYLVKRLVQYIGGEIWFESKLKHGTTFYFAIPLKGIVKTQFD